MNLVTASQLSTEAFIAITTLAYFIGGAVKGTLGVGMPITVVTTMTFVTDARTAIVLVIFPIIMTNLWQILRSGNITSVISQYWRLAASMTFFLLASSALALSVPLQLITILLGIAVVIFAVINLLTQIPFIPDRLDPAAQLGTGFITGVLGGLTGLTVVPLVAYFSARDLDREAFITATCPFFLLGGFLLMFSYSRNGLFTHEYALLSLALVIPATIGFLLGENIRQVISRSRFRKFVLILFMATGLNLIAGSIEY